MGGTLLEVWTDWARKCDFQGVRTDSRPVLFLKMENRWAFFTKKVGAASKICPCSAALRISVQVKDLLSSHQERSRKVSRLEGFEQPQAALCLRFSATFVSVKAVSMKTKVPVNQQCASTAAVRPGATNQLNLLGWFHTFCLFLPAFL